MGVYSLGTTCIVDPIESVYSYWTLELIVQKRPDLLEHFIYWIVHLAIEYELETSFAVDQ